MRPAPRGAAGAAWRAASDLGRYDNFPRLSLLQPSGDDVGIGDVLLRAKYVLLRSDWGDVATQLLQPKRDDDGQVAIGASRCVSRRRTAEDSRRSRGTAA